MVISCGNRKMSPSKEFPVPYEHDTNDYSRKRDDLHSETTEFLLRRDMLLSVKHPILWIQPALFFALLITTTILEMSEFGPEVAWLSLAYLALTMAWFIWLTLMVMIPGLHSAHLIFPRLAGVMLSRVPGIRTPGDLTAAGPGIFLLAGPGFLLLLLTPFTVGMGVFFSITVINNQAPSYPMPAEFLALMSNGPRSSVDALYAFGAVTLVVLIALFRVWRYRWSEARYCPVCGNILRHATSNQCAECGSIQYHPPDEQH